MHRIARIAVLAALPGLPVPSPAPLAAQTALAKPLSSHAVPIGRAPSADGFVIAPGDVVRVRVWPDSLLGGDFPVEDSGVVHLPLLGVVPAAGKTVEELSDHLRDGYAQDLRLPVVSVMPLFRVSVLGAVRSPGVYWIDPGYGLFELVSEAGGLTAGARPDRIEVWSRDRPTPVEAELEPGTHQAGLSLRSGDRVVIPRSSGVSWLAVLQGLTLAVSVTSLITR